MPFPLPHATRNQVFTALFNFIRQLPAPPNQKWVTFSQRLKSWDDTPPVEQPAVFLHRLLQTATQNHAYGVTKWHWKATIWIYFRTESYQTDNTYPDQVTDPFIDSIEQLFQTEPGAGALTLGDLVKHCWIDGDIYSDPGLEDYQAVIIIPISILI